MKKVFVFLIIVGGVAYFTKPSLKDAKTLYEQNDSISKSIREELIDGGELNSFLEDLLSLGISELSGLELKLYQKDMIVYREFYLVVHQINQDRDYQLLFAVGGFTQLIELDASLEGFEEIYDLSAFDSSVDLNL